MLSLRRHLRANEVHDFAQLLALLERVFLPVNKEDERLWSPDSKGEFSIKSFYTTLSGGRPIEEGWQKFCICWCPQEFLAFVGWLG